MRSPTRTGPALRYNIETKVEADHPGASAEPQEFVDVILAAVRAAGKVDRVEIQSFDWRTLPMVHQAEPSIPLVALYNEETWAPDSPWLAGVNAAVIGDPLIGAKMMGADIVSPRYHARHRQTVRRSVRIRWGSKIIPWTVNDADAMREQIGYGVDGIITDFPTRAAPRDGRARHAAAAGLPPGSVSWHRVGPSDMALEAKRIRHLAVAVP